MNRQVAVCLRESVAEIDRVTYCHLFQVRRNTFDGTHVSEKVEEPEGVLGAINLQRPHVKVHATAPSRDNTSGNFPTTLLREPAQYNNINDNVKKYFTKYGSSFSCDRQWSILRYKTKLWHGGGLNWMTIRTSLIFSVSFAK